MIDLKNIQLIFEIRFYWLYKCLFNKNDVFCITVKIDNNIKNE